MKRWLTLGLFTMMAALSALAQNTGELITLNDATPSINVVIALPQDTTGAVSVDFSGAAVHMTDANGSIVFTASDARLHGVELNIAPNSGSHTLTVERLPGVADASVRLTSLPELTTKGTTQLLPTSTSNAITLNQEMSLPLSAAHPGESVKLSIPAETTGVVTSTFPGASATTQLVDSAGVVLVDSVGGQVDGVTLVLDAGDYQFTVLGNQLTQNVVAGIRAVSTTDIGLAVLETPEPAVVEAANTTVSVPNTTAAACTATVAVNSTNLRSGPGTGYSVLGYGYLGQAFQVGGQNPENNWIVVGTNSGSAWVINSNVQMQGNCSSLTVFNIPLRNAQSAPLVVSSSPADTSSANSVPVVSAPTGSSEGEHDGGEHKGGESEGGEHEGGED